MSYEHYSPEDRERIFTAVEEMLRRGITCRKACGLVGIDMSSLLDWVEADPAKAQRYENARKRLYDHWAEDITEIADTPHMGVITVEKLLGTEKTYKDAIDHRRLRIDTRKWLLSKLRPATYGDKVQLGGAADLPPIKSDVVMTPDEAYRQMLEGRKK